MVVELAGDGLHQLVVLPVEGEPCGLECYLEEGFHGVVGQLVHVKYPASRTCMSIKTRRGRPR